MWKLTLGQRLRRHPRNDLETFSLVPKCGWSIFRAIREWRTKKRGREAPFSFKARKADQALTGSSSLPESTAM